MMIDNDVGTSARPLLEARGAIAVGLMSASLLAAHFTSAWRLHAGLGTVPSSCVAPRSSGGLIV